MPRSSLPAVAALLGALACSSPPANQPTVMGAGTGGTAPNAGAAGSGGSAAAGAGAGGVGSGGASAAGSGGTAGVGGADSGTWPQNAVAAVSLTYDDGLDTAINIAAPALDGQGLKGTFFLSNFEGVDHEWALPNLTSPLNARHMAWQALAGSGHELAGHTVNHPCNSDSKAAGYRLTDYDSARMSTELDDSLARLARLGGLAPFTFAYPCASDVAGIGPSGEDYSPLVAARFMASRVSVSGIANPTSVELAKVPQLDGGGKTGDELRAMVDQAITQGGWLVILFHGVGAEASCTGQGLSYAPQTCMINYLTTTEEAHASLVSYLGEKKSQVWTATFKQVAERIASKR